jgi:hypothetical protein
MDGACSVLKPIDAKLSLFAGLWPASITEPNAATPTVLPIERK